MMMLSATNDLQQWIDSLSGPGAKQMVEIGIGSFLLLMTISALAGLFVSLLYRVFFRSRSTGSEIHRAFPLIALSVTAIFITIQFSLPLSLGLLGALSIVRFRTPVKEPEEIGFLMLVVASGLCCATFNLLFLGVVMLVAVCMLTLMSARKDLLGGARSHGLVILSLPAPEYQRTAPQLLAVLQEHLPRGKLDSVNETADEVTLSYSFLKLDPGDAVELQAVLRRTAEGLTSDLYFSRGS